eukprot:3846714-Amphidinium_carterae.1
MLGQETGAAGDVTATLLGRALDGPTPAESRRLVHVHLAVRQHPLYKLRAFPFSVYMLWTLIIARMVCLCNAQLVEPLPMHASVSDLKSWPAAERSATARLTCSGAEVMAAGTRTTAQSQAPAYQFSSCCGC